MNEIVEALVIGAAVELVTRLTHRSPIALRVAAWAVYDFGWGLMLYPRIRDAQVSEAES